MWGVCGTVDRGCCGAPCPTSWAGIVTDLHALAQQELDVIDWSCGLIPMPAHLVELGTVRLRYTHRVVLDGPLEVAKTLTEGSVMPTSVIPHRIEPLRRPVVETWVWGELVAVEDAA